MINIFYGLDLVNVVGECGIFIMVLILSFWVSLDGWVIGIIKELCKICKIFYVLNFI